MLLLLLIYVVLRALWTIDVHLISTLVNKSLYHLLLFKHVTLSGVFHKMYVCTCNLSYIIKYNDWFEQYVTISAMISSRILWTRISLHCLHSLSLPQRRFCNKQNKCQTMLSSNQIAVFVFEKVEFLFHEDSQYTGVCKILSRLKIEFTLRCLEYLC